MTDELKIHWFQNGITNKSFNAVCASINADPSKFTTFTAVQEAYVTFKLQQRQNDPPMDAKLPLSGLVHAARTRPAVDADVGVEGVTARKASSALRSLPLATLLTVTTPILNIGP